MTDSEPSDEQVRDVAEGVVGVMAVAIDCADLGLEQSLVALRSCIASLMRQGVTPARFATAFAVAAESTDSIAVKDVARALLKEAEKT